MTQEEEKKLDDIIDKMFHYLMILVLAVFPIVLIILLVNLIISSIRLWAL